MAYRVGSAFRRTELNVINLTIDDMTCSGCVASITRVINGLDPDAIVDANVDTKRVSIDSPIDTDAIVAAITYAGYHPQIAQ